MESGAKRGNTGDENERPYPWSLFWVLLGAGFLGNLAVLPLALTLRAPEAGAYHPGTIVFHQFLQIGVLVLAVGPGLALGRRTGLGAPILDDWLSGGKIGPHLKTVLPASIVAGVAVGIALCVLDFLFQPFVPAVQTASGSGPGPWKGFLASFYGGIDEELFMRLFSLSLLVWLLSGAWSRSRRTPGPFTLWTANILAALLFGMGHLPTALAVMPPTAMVILRVITLNAVGGVVFGFLYLKKGLESAMAAHFCADIIIHVVLPALAV